MSERGQKALQCHDYTLKIAKIVLAEKELESVSSLILLKRTYERLLFLGQDNPNIFKNENQINKKNPVEKFEVISQPKKDENQGSKRKSAEKVNDINQGKKEIRYENVLDDEILIIGTREFVPITRINEFEITTSTSNYQNDSQELISLDFLKSKVIDLHPNEESQPLSDSPKLSSMQFNSESIPRVPPLIEPAPSSSRKSNEYENFKCTQVVRKKDQRKNLHGRDCPCCEAFYQKVLPIDDAKNRVNAVSRHRSLFVAPQTPPGYWETTFTQN